MKIVDKIKVGDKEIITVKSNDAWITNADESMFCQTEIWLAENDSPDNYKEVTEEYKEQNDTNINTNGEN